MRRVSQFQERNLWRIVEGATAIGGLSSFCWGWGLWMHFAYTRPTSANALEGRVFTLDTHGWRVYLDAREHFTLECNCSPYPVCRIGRSSARLAAGCWEVERRSAAEDR